MYMPTLARFMSRDPLYPDVDLLSDNNRFGRHLDAMAQNPYIYVSNNPLSNVDPSGMAADGPNQRRKGDGPGKPAKSADSGYLVIDPSCAGHCFWMKPEKSGQPKRWECTTGVAFQADGVWGVCRSGRAFKISNGCTLTISCNTTCDGTLHAVCTVECEGVFYYLGQLRGYCVTDPWTNDPPKVPPPPPSPALRNCADCDFTEVLAPPGM